MAKINGREVTDEELDLWVLWHLMACGNAGKFPLGEWLRRLQVINFRGRRSASMVSIQVEVENRDVAESLTRLVRAGMAKIGILDATAIFMIVPTPASPEASEVKFLDGFENQIKKWREEALARDD